MIAQGSVKYIIPFFICALLVALIHPYLGIPFLGFALYLIWFFRDPKREIVNNRNMIHAAADGEVIIAEHNQNSMKIGIRMSPFDVHLNRSPIDGEIIKIKHKPGNHLSVYFGDVEKKNEQNLIVTENEELYVEILQITGIFARRIECWVKEGDIVNQGQKIGMIRFGSQTNIFIKSKKDNKQLILKVNIGDKVKAGLSILAQIED